jgi:two-component system, sensor histidine kinase PdtaS
MRFLIILVLLSGLSGTPVFCQSTAEGLAVPHIIDTTPVETLLARLDRLPPDTFKVRSLLELSRYYWYLGKAGNLDTCLYWAERANQLSFLLQDTARAAEAVFMRSKVLVEMGRMTEARRQLSLVDGEARVRLLLVLAERYTNHEPVDIPYLDNAAPYVAHALQLSDSVHSDRWRNECMMLMAKYYFERGDLQRGENTILQIIAFYHLTGDRLMEAHYWAELDVYMPEIDSTYREHLRGCRNAYTLYREAGTKEDALFALRDWAVTELNYGHLADAEEKFKTVLGMFSDLKKKPTPLTVLNIAELYLDKNDMAQVISYALEGLDLLTPSDQRYLFSFHYILSESFSRLGQIDNALVHARTAMVIAERNNFADIFYLSKMIVDDLLAKDSARSAASFIRQFTMAHPPASPQQERVIAYCNAVIYDHWGQFTTAENYFLRMVSLESASQKEVKHQIFMTLYISPSDVALSIAKFYIHWGKNREALSYLLEASNAMTARPAEDKRMLELLLFRVYQALGNSCLALLHHIRYTDLSDSIFNVEKIKQFQTLLMRYETRQREQALQLVQLQNQKELVQVQEISLQRNMTLGGILLLLIFALLALRGYRLTRKHVLQLQMQQTIIYRQNAVQQDLIGEKDKLLTDKDLLLDEIHHSVQNNLTIIISLLESQSMYLNNQPAQAALQDTQNRIQAVFLLQQKLYRGTEGTEVDAVAYILELLDYLCLTFDTHARDITVTHMLEYIAFDATELLPLAVILNEAITNSIKYAFPGNGGGKIRLSLRGLATGEIILQIRDNGVGLPADNRHLEKKSLGLSLITGLVKQLNGICTIENDGGVLITIKFRPRRAATKT